ncbi:MAG: hypothetical protein HYR83_10435, partial [Planctomycetes bacterium]|nr:hypothetical protein [Planctomycetota bacterium]
GTDTGGGSSGGSGGGGTTVTPPAVTITATPLQGQSPLYVTFNGNAVSAGTIDESRTSWDFDISDGIGTDATSRMASHSYQVASGDTKTFFARLTMYDTDGRSGYAQVGIKVTSPDQSGGGQVGNGNLQIIVSLPSATGLNVSEGTSPFEVLLNIDSTGLTGTLQSVVWDLGDGSRASSISIPHTYTNTGDTDLRIPITATVTMVSGSTTATFNTTRVITVHPGTAAPNPGPPVLPGTTPPGAGGAATPCSGLGMLPLFVMLASLVGMKTRMRFRN